MFRAQRHVLNNYACDIATECCCVNSLNVSPASVLNLQLTADGLLDFENPLPLRTISNVESMHTMLGCTDVISTQISAMICVGMSELIPILPTTKQILTLSMTCSRKLKLDPMKTWDGSSATRSSCAWC